jgi:glycosyltransferase involved in cell wall biosynthesis
LAHNNYLLVTIGIPTYNRADSFLKQGLDSALKQTYPNVEIIVSDNCSTDNTEDVVKGFNDPRIRYFKQNVNIGAINNSNFCLEQARGDYFMQLQDDDMIDHDFLETCMKAANYSTDIGIIRTGTRVIDSDNNILHEYSNVDVGLSTVEFFRNWFACKTPIYLCSTLFNTKRLKEVSGFRSKHNLFDDAVAIVRLSKFSRVDVTEIKASFRKHGGEETFAAEINDWCEDSLYLLDHICDFADEKQRKLLRKEGVQFLSRINYNFAGAIESPLERFSAYIQIYRMYNYNHIPYPVIKSIKKLIFLINPVSYIRFVKKQYKRSVSKYLMS